MIIRCTFTPQECFICRKEFNIDRFLFLYWAQVRFSLAYREIDSVRILITAYRIDDCFSYFQQLWEYCTDPRYHGYR